MAEPLIVAENLVKIYRIGDLELQALQGLELTVQQGEVMALIGTSGSGKSTFLNVIGGLDRPNAGKISVAGQDLLKMSDVALNRYRRRYVGFVWQQKARNLIPYLNALQNVEMPMLMAGMPPKERHEWSHELLDLMGIGARRRHHLAQLSGGEQQRVAIAVALANKPPLLLADEPTGEVDGATAQVIFDLFHDLNERLGTTIVIVSHDAQIARQVHRVVAIRDGKTSSEVVRRAAEPLPEGEEHTEETSHTLTEYVVLDSAGRLQVPREVRERYNIGDRVILEEVDGALVLRPVQREGEPAITPLVEPDDAPPPPKKGLLGTLLSRGRKR
jgi:ABC-type lipoprotein export system ATPase subunit/bifunctional DNA-binding transcriptional regulator/antitoxin component of YhaV-PrlF toxin-antitoxin module